LSEYESVVQYWLSRYNFEKNGVAKTKTMILRIEKNFFDF